MQKKNEIKKAINDLDENLRILTWLETLMSRLPFAKRTFECWDTFNNLPAEKKII